MSMDHFSKYIVMYAEKGIRITCLSEPGSFIIPDE